MPQELFGRTVSGEGGGENGTPLTGIDWEITQVVMEPIDQVAPTHQDRSSFFTCLTTSDGSKIWFDAKKATGPLPITAGQKQGGVRYVH
jgi:hypothetical protein